MQPRSYFTIKRMTASTGIPSPLHSPGRPSQIGKWPLSLEPTLNYYIPDGSQLHTIRKEQAVHIQRTGRPPHLLIKTHRPWKLHWRTVTEQQRLLHPLHKGSYQKHSRQSAGSRLWRGRQSASLCPNQLPGDGSGHRPYANRASPHLLCPKRVGRGVHM